MNQASRLLLEKLFHAWQGDPERTRKFRLPITLTRAAPYFEAKLPDAKEALHAGLQEAEAAGCVSLEWGRGYDSHLLYRITLENAVNLAHYLEIPLAAAQAASARSTLVALLSGRVGWISEWVEDLLAAWSLNRTFSGVSPGDISTAGLLVRALEAVVAGRHLNLDLRTFSIRELGNSKAMEFILARFAAVWKLHHPTELRNDELLETLGLVKFPLPLLLRGPVILKLAGRDLSCGGIAPFVGVPPQAIQGVSFETFPEYVLTIENLASFNRHAAEIIDQGLVLYSAGFPAPGVAGFLRLLDASLPANIPFFHWGDIDEGGLKIFDYIQGLIGRPLQQHLMTEDLLVQRGQPRPGLRIDEVRRSAEKGTLISNLAKAMVEMDPPKILEQENVDPAPLRKVVTNEQ
jgi:hypothetical protein